MLTALDWIVIAAYLVLTLLLGFWLHRKASENINAFFLGGRDLPWWALGASGMASNVDVAGTMVMGALVYALGVKGLYIEIRGGMVLILPFLMIFMGKWTRRAQVMTVAEWMTLRFGDGHEGRMARLMSAIAQLVIHVWIISYFAVGGGKFFGAFLGIDDRWASILMILVTMVYATASGFYGVVWTDVFQGGIILAGIVYLVMKAMMLVDLPETFDVAIPSATARGTFETLSVKFSEWSSIAVPSHLDLPGQYSAYNAFALVIGFYLLKTCIEGFGGAGGYMGQRYFAAKSDRDCGLLSAFWIFLLAFRWPLVTAIAVLGLHYSLTVTPLNDPELALPTVIAHYAPTGMKGFLVACFMAAAMSTFVAIINAAASYWVKDIYQAFLRPQASEKSLVTQSRVAGVVIVSLGILFSFPVVNINDIWGWITLAFGAGLSVPLVFRWYWARFNGYGFAWGTFVGMASAVGVRFVPLPMGEELQFLVPTICSAVACVLGSLLTKPTDAAVVRKFYAKTRPFGFWSTVLRELPADTQTAIRTENRRDVISIIISIPWMVTMSLAGMLFVMKRWDEFSKAGGIFAILTVALYFTWFRHLDKHAPQKA